MFKLIRDNIPELMAKAGVECNYATAETNNLYAGMLRDKLIEEVNEFLTAGTLEELVDIVTVVNAFLALNGISTETFEKAYEEKLKTHGGFEKKLIGFFADEPQNESSDK